MDLEFIKWAVGLLFLFWSLYKAFRTGSARGYI